MVNWSKCSSCKTDPLRMMNRNRPKRFINIKPASKMVKKFLFDCKKRHRLEYAYIILKPIGSFLSCLQHMTKAFPEFAK